MDAVVLADKLESRKKSVPRMILDLMWVDAGMNTFVDLTFTLAPSSRRGCYNLPFESTSAWAAKRFWELVYEKTGD